MGTVKRSRNSTSVLTANGAHPRGGTSVRSWLESVRDRATARRQSGEHRIASTRTQFSGTRSRPSDESGNEIMETQYFYSLHEYGNCDVCLRTKITNASCRKRTGEALPRAQKFGDLITSDHKVLNEDVNPETITGTLSWYKILPLNGYSRTRAKQKSSHETEKSLLKFLEPSHTPKVVFTDNSMEFGRACEVLSWNHHTSTPYRSETNCIAERAVRRVKEGTSAVLLQSGLDERWWSDSMECNCYLRNVQDLVADGKTPCEGRLGEPFKGPMIPFGPIVEHHPTSPKDQARIHQFDKKVLPGIFLGYELIAERIWKGYFDSRPGRFGKVGCIKFFYPRRINAKEVLIRQKDDEFIFPTADGTAKLSGRDYEFREPTQKREPTVRSEDLSGDIQSELGESQPTFKRWRWSPKRLWSSQWTSSSTLRAEGGNIPCSTEIHWCYDVHSYWSGCVTREQDWRLLECRRAQKLVRFLERVHEIYFVEGEASKKKDVVWERDWQRSKQLPDQFGRKLVEPLRIEKNRNGQKRNRSSTILEDWEEFVLLIQTTENTQKFSKMQEESWKRPMAPAMPSKRQPSVVKANVMPKIGNEKGIKTMDDCIVESLESTRQRAESCPLRYTGGQMSPQKCGVTTQIAKIKRQSRAPGAHCKRRLWSLRSLHWTRLVCVPDDCCKNNERCCKITRLWWTSSWCSTCVHSGKIGGCSQIAQNSQIRMSRWLDTFRTTQMAIIMGKNWRSRGTSWTKFEWISTCWALVGETVGGLFNWEKFRIGNVCSFVGNKDYVCQCM